MYEILHGVKCLRTSFSPTPLLRPMKLIILILITAILSVHASSFGQKITLHKTNAPLAEVIKAIREQTGYDFFYNNQVIKKAHPVTLNLDNATLTQVLVQCFDRQPLTYRMEGNIIIIQERPVKNFQASPKPVDTTGIRGIVVDQKGDPLVGASISIYFNNKLFLQMAAGSNGGFYIKGPIPKLSTLKVSFIGYAAKEIEIKANVGIISLALASSQLDETHVIGYGTESRRFSVGSTATLTARQIENQPVNNILEALQGQIPGLNITNINGVPGSEVRVQVRGQNTLQSNTNSLSPYDQPLFIIDGVPFAPQNRDINQLSAFVGSNGAGFSPFNNINPSDIESISVLKDADATSIYGSQGSNGVILITTKKGKSGPTSFNLSANSGYSMNTRPVTLLNTDQYLQVRRAALANDGVNLATAPASAYPDLLVFDQTKYTDFYKDILGKSAKNTDIHASVSGGNLNNTFIVSGGYTKDNYSYPGDYADERFTTHANLHHNSSDARFTLDFGTDLSYDQNNSSSSASTSNILLPPNLPDLLDSQGNLVWNYQGIALTPYQFYGYLKQPALLESYNLNNTMHLGYKIITGLSFDVNLGYNRFNTMEQNSIPASSQPPGSGASSASFAANTQQSINIEPQFNYKHDIGKGVLTALLGTTYKKLLVNGNAQYGYGYGNDNLLTSISGATTVKATDHSDIYKYEAIFGRLVYIDEKKYIVSLTGRRDGSSNFGPGRQYGNFGSAGLGWIFTEESFFEPLTDILSYGKISANYGTSGSDAISSYQYQAFWSPNTLAGSFEGLQPYFPKNLYNPDYSWATKKSLNVSLDLGFFKDRLLINGTYYKTIEDNQLVNYPLPTQTGFTSVLGNLNAKVQNQGLEFSLTAKTITNKDFRWSTSFNISGNRNKLLAFPGLATSSYASIYVIGQPVTVQYGFNYKGVNPTTGIFEFYNAKGQVSSLLNYNISTQGGDKVPIADLAPKFFGGFGNNFDYKNFSLSLFFQFSKQTALNYLSDLYTSSHIPGLQSNIPVEALDYWQKPGDVTNLEKLTAVQSSDAYKAARYFVLSSGAYSDDTYLRLKTLSLSYNLPQSLLKKINVKGCKIYARGQNLLTFTNYKVGDPEQPGAYDSFPIQKTFVIGLLFNY